MSEDIILYIVLTIPFTISIILAILVRKRKNNNEEQAYDYHASRFTLSRGNASSSATAERVPPTISTIYSTELQREMNDTLPAYHEVVIEDLPTYHEVMNGYRYDNNSGVVR